MEDGSGAVSDRGNRGLRGSKGHKGADVIAADNIHAVVITNIAARIREIDVKDHKKSFYK